MAIRRADPNELPAVMNVLDGALLATSAEHVVGAIRAGRVLVATEGDRVLGAILLDDDADVTRIEAIAVRRARRGQGIGTELVRAAAGRHGRLVAEFEAGVRPFWESLGFDVEPGDEHGRFVGTLETGAAEP